MESEKFTSSGLYWLCMEAENRSCAVDSPVSEHPSQPIEKTSDSQPNVAPVTAAAISVAGVKGAPAVGRIAGEKRRRGRPPKAEAMRAPLMKRSKMEDEDVCFICFDGGDLVLCDRGDCPKAYHPACIKRDAAFFHSKAKWNCGWHFCSKCLKPAHYLCYTCPYSLCKACTKDADYLCVRGNKGFCATCMRVVSMIENIDHGNKNVVQVDFDDNTTWEYLFKVYWMCLKGDLSLTIDEIIRAQKPSRSSSKGTGRRKSSAVYYVGNNGAMTREEITLCKRENSCSTGKAICDNINNKNGSVLSPLWASNELLDFVAHMRNGDTSPLPQKEVQALLLEYIKRNNLRNPHQRSEIICDSKLANLFGKPRVRHFEMLSLLEFHFHTTDDPQKGEIGGVILDPIVGQEEGVSDIDNLPVVGENYGPKIHNKETERVDINMVNVREDACEKSVNQVDSSGSTNNNSNNQTCLKRESPLGFKSETSVASHSTGSTPAADDREAENLWFYREPNGKVLGPFGIVQLHKWSDAGVFPPDMRIWSSNNVERNSVPLTDVLRGQVSLEKDHSLSPQDIKGTSHNASHHCDRRWSGTANSNGLDIDAHSNDNKLEFAKGSGPTPHSSDWMTSVITSDSQIGNSSKSGDVNTSKVNLSYSDQTEVHCVERSSSFTEQRHENSLHQARSDMDQMWNSVPNYEDWGSQGNMITQATGRQCHENEISNSQLHLGQPSAEVPLPQTNPVNNWNSDESHHHSAFMANLTESSKQKFSIDLQNFPTTLPKTSNQEFNVQTVKEQLWEPPQVSVQDLCIQNVLSLTPKSIDNDDKAEFRNQEIASLTNHNEKIQAAENKYSLSPSCPAQDSGPSWSSASSLVLGGGNQLCKKAQKPCIEEWDSGFLSVASLKSHDVASDHVATPTSKCDELVPPSPPNPVPNASSWLAMVTEPIEFSTLAEESVSDLLAEVDAMESHSDLASPNMVMDYGEDLFQDSKTDCFTSLRGLGSPLDRGKNDALSSSGDIHLASHSTMRDEPLQAPTIDALDPLKKSRGHSSSSTVMEVETNRCNIPVNQFEVRPSRPHLSPQKKTRDLADIMNASAVDTGRGTKHGNLNLSGSIRRDQGTPRVTGSKNRSMTAGFAARESHQKHGGDRLTSPRDRNLPSGLTSPRDRNIPGGDSGFSKGRPQWSRQSAFGGGGSGSHSRPPSRGQRVCKFYESGYCRKGAFCDYLHP